MDDIIDIVNEATSDADAREKAEAERQAEALAEWHRQEAARKKAANRRADVKVLLRAVAFAVFHGGMIAAVRAGLVDPSLGGIMLMLGIAWFGFHFGAWFQFRARKEDKLYG